MKNNDFPVGFLFDFDGVIVNSVDSHVNAWKEAFEKTFQKKLTYFPHEELAGKSPHLISEHLANAAGSIEKSLELYLLKGDILHSSNTPPILLPGVKEIQQFLAIRSIPHGIASNATRMFVKNSVAQLDLGFKHIFGLENYKFPKPNPEAYITLANHLEIPAREYKNVWVFEDSLTGTKAAVDAGMVPIGILTMNTKEQMEAAGSQHTFPTLLEAFEYIENPANFN